MLQIVITMFLSGIRPWLVRYRKNPYFIHPWKYLYQKIESTLVSLIGQLQKLSIAAEYKNKMEEMKRDWVSIHCASASKHSPGISRIYKTFASP